MTKIIEKNLSFSRIRVCLYQIGNDYQITVEGGGKPHIGSVVMAIPRPSLNGDDDRSCTSSVMNLVGHKDEAICRIFAEKISRERNAVVVCSGGFHMDHISKEQIDEVIEMAKLMSKELFE